MNESKGARYQRLRRRAEAVGVAAGLAMLAAVAVTPASGWLAAWAYGASRGLTGAAREAVALAVFVGLAVLLWEIVALPAVLYLGLTVDRIYRGAEHSVEGVLAAQAQATLVGLPAAFVAAVVVMVSMRVAGAWWWIVAGLVLAAVLTSALRAVPALLLGFAGARPVARAGLAQRLDAVAHRARVPVDRIEELLVGGSDRATALVVGVGRSRRVLLSSEIVRDWSDDEIAVVVAHELAHHAYFDLWSAVALDAAVLSVGLGVADMVVQAVTPSLGFTGTADLRTLPVIALVSAAVWVLATPARHGLSRSQEQRADRFALSVTGGVDAFRSAILRLSARHLADERPSALTRWLYYRHPSVAERLAAADKFGDRTTRDQ